jgi:hypothetical protein
MSKLQMLPAAANRLENSKRISGAGFFSINKSSKILVQSPSITLMKCDAADPGEILRIQEQQCCDEYPSLLALEQVLVEIKFKT